MVTNTPYEFCKLDSIDLKVAQWIYYHCPHSLDSYLEFVSNHTYAPKGIAFNTKKASAELLEVHGTNPSPFQYY